MLEFSPVLKCSLPFTSKIQFFTFAFIRIRFISASPNFHLRVVPLPSSVTKRTKTFFVNDCFISHKEIEKKRKKKCVDDENASAILVSQLSTHNSQLMRNAGETFCRKVFINSPIIFFLFRFSFLPRRSRQRRKKEMVSYRHNYVLRVILFENFGNEIRVVME